MNNFGKSKKRFINKENIGNGTYGKVYKAYDNKLSQTIALKIMKI